MRLSVAETVLMVRVSYAECYCELLEVVHAGEADGSSDLTPDNKPTDWSTYHQHLLPGLLEWITPPG